MELKLNLTYPLVITANKEVSVTLPDNLSYNEIVDWVYKNKQEIARINGCNLSDVELISAISNGSVIIKINK